MTTRIRGRARAAIAAGATILAAAFGGSLAGPAAAASPPVQLTASFSPGARLGGTASVRVGLRIDSRQLPSPITEVGVLTPAGLDIASSELGLATCRRSDADFANVLVEGSTENACPANALLGTGSAVAELRMRGTSRPINGLATINLFSAAPRNGGPGLVLVVDTSNPVSTQLIYGGHLHRAPRPFGLGMTLLLPAMPAPPLGAVVALVGLQMEIGGRDIVYSRREGGRRIHYRPGGLALPDRCPRGGLRFRVSLRFADGGRRSADTRLRCPRRGSRSR